MLTARDAQRLQGVHPTLVATVERVFQEMHDAGTPMFVVGGVRTASEQHDLWLKGRNAAGQVLDAKAIVTTKDGFTLKSDHQPNAAGVGCAVDVAFVPTKARTDAWDQAWPWQAVGESAEKTPGVKWGGRWKKPADLDHLQLEV